MEYDSLSLLKFKNRELIKSLEGEIPSPDTLATWTNQLGADKASFLLYEAILASPEQKNFIEFVYHQKPQRQPLTYKTPIQVLVISSSNQKLSKWGSHVDLIKLWMHWPCFDKIL